MKTRLKVSVIFLFFVTFALSCFYIFYLISLAFGKNDDSVLTAKSCSHHVLILGESENESFLSSIYDGARSLGQAYDCVVELYVPKNHAARKNLQSLLNFASFTNPDGIIVCIPESDEKIEFPENIMDNEIPVVTLAQYHPELPQISYIGTNYSEVGRKIAMESAEYLSDRGRIAVINVADDSGPNYSTLMNSLTNTLSSHSEIQTVVLDFNNSRNIDSSGADIKKMITQKSVELLVCLTSEDTIRVAQLVSEIHMDGKIGIIGFGDGDVLETYLNKGTVTELLSIDSEKIGRTAIKELFEYIRQGYANNYIAADVKVRRSGKK
ncbi:MAG: substrate-binding domain-containing protein [Treponema sp.]|nr:substrate-binding domain-containing protein [Treponema sp.]